MVVTADCVTALATVVLAIATTALAVAAIIGGYIALAQLKSTERSERIRETFSTVRAYSVPTGELPSPLMAYGRLDKKPYDDPAIAVPTLGVESLRQYVAEVSELFIILQNYFDEADDKLRRNLVDSDLFLSRQYRVMQQSAALLRRYQAFVPPQYVNEQLIARMEADAADYEKTHPTTGTRGP
jgi:hypothetical protein